MLEIRVMIEAPYVSGMPSCFSFELSPASLKTLLSARKAVLADAVVESNSKIKQADQKLKEAFDSDITRELTNIARESLTAQHLQFTKELTEVTQALALLAHLETQGNNPNKL